ncbi:MAG: hypothetical protein ACLGQX_09135 [Acidobacteriota bacterium]|jgi:hypothetical protein
MFERSVRVEYGGPDGNLAPCPIQWLDNFAMRNFTNDAVFDDTLPVADGVLEIGNRVPIGRLRAAMQEWFRKKGYLQPEDELRVRLP